MPCSERLWRQSDHLQWQESVRHAAQSPDADSRFPASICALFATVSTTQKVPSCLSESAQLALILAAFTEHLHILDLSKTIRTSQHSSPYSALVISLQGCLDNVLHEYTEQKTEELYEPNNLRGDCIVLARLAYILSFTSERLLLQFSHWQATPSAIENARRQLQLIMKQQAARSRECAYHAAQLFEYFRRRPSLTHTDPFCLLLSTLYLWAYIELVLLDPAVQASRPLSQPGVQIRLDRPFSSGEKADWVIAGASRIPHISGVGVLDSPRSVRTLLREASRIMRVGAFKSDLLTSMSGMLHSQALGHMPVS